MGLLGSQNPFSGAPSYKAIAHLPVPERVAAMRDPETRARILSEDRFAGSNFPLLDPAVLRPHVPLRRPAGLHPAAGEQHRRPGRPRRPHARRRSPTTCCWPMTARASSSAPLTNYADYTVDASEELLRHPNTIVGLSDGGAHVGFISDGSFPSYLLTYWGKVRGADGGGADPPADQRHRRRRRAARPRPAEARAARRHQRHRLGCAGAGPAGHAATTCRLAGGG